MSHKVMVIVLDGASFIFCNHFLWFMNNVKYIFHNFHRKMLYIDDNPVTPTILNNFFTGKYSREHGVKGFRTMDKPWSLIGEYKGEYIWDLARRLGYTVKVLNVPVKVPVVNINVHLHGANWIDLWLPRKDHFREDVERLHNIAVYNASQDWDLFIVWYPIPDQAHHYFFPTLHDFNALKTAFYWYDLAFKYARHLIEIAKPKYWIILSDHGFTSDFEHIVIDKYKQPVHCRDGLAVSNSPFLPDSTIYVHYWILYHLHYMK